MRNQTQELLLKSESISEFLQKEYLRRLDRNSNYSLRAFARDLKLSPSRLSESLNSNRNLSVRNVDKISAQLKLTAKAQSFLRDLCLSKGHANEGVRSFANERLKDIRQKNDIQKLDAEKFKVISDWYHSAILEMTALSCFRSDTQWIAKKLSLPVIHAQNAVERLLTLGLLKEKNGKWMATPEILSTSSKVPSSAIRKFHRQMLEKSYRSLQDDEMETRDINSMILAVPSEKLSEFRDQIQIFMKEFWEKLEGQEKDQLYALNIQLIPLTRRENEI